MPNYPSKPAPGLSRRRLLAGGVTAAVVHALPSVRSAEAGLRVFPDRECYCPAHFGNSYEAMWPREMAAYLAEMKEWGFNRYGDWITTTDVCDPYTSDAFWNLAKEQLERKRQAFRAAAALGMKLNLIVTPNHVYLDQLRPQYAATKAPKIFGQLVCPSQPEARKLILDNFSRWFQDFRDSGIELSSMTAFAYDYGGCGCAQCKPWIVTFARLMKEIHGIARKTHPAIEPWFCSWWWTPEEHQQLSDWANREADGWLKAVTLHIEYGKTQFKDVPLPRGCRKLAFVHIGYGDNSAVGDVYTKWGGVVAPLRIPGTLAGIAAQGADGFQAYSEGVFDDANKALLAGLGSGRFPSSEAVLEEYARRHLAQQSGDAAAWARWIAQWGDRTKAPLPAARQEFDRLCGRARPGWRLEHWRSKLVLEELDRAIGLPKPDGWTAENLARVDRFWAEQERLQREVYRLGPVRHVFARKFMPPRWYDSWQKARQAAPRQQHMLPEA